METRAIPGMETEIPLVGPKNAEEDARVAQPEAVKTDAQAIQPLFEWRLNMLEIRVLVTRYVQRGA